MRASKGADEPANYSAVNADGTLVDVRHAVAGVYGWTRDSGFRFIGTSFFIGRDIALTAKHVVEEFHEGETQCLFQFRPGNRVALRDVHEFCLSGTSDMAAIRLRGRTGADNPSLTLACAKPSPGCLAFSLACPNTQLSGPVGAQRLESDYEFFRGTVRAHFADGRDRSMMPWPCYQVDFHLHAGSSGGPVFDASGRVFAINCASYSPDTNIAFASDIDLALGLGLRDVVIGNKSYAVATIRDFINEGIIRYE